MAAADVQAPPAEPAPAVPDYLASPNAVFNDQGVQWRYGRAPDYSKTRKVWEEGKKSNHAAGSLPQLVENLVKNWEVEASFKPRLQDWRTIDHDNYSFAINGGPGQSGEHMLKVGTYNAIIAPNEYYSPENSDFASSHKTFKRMMPTFAWEVTEVYSGPPKVAFKWRHWGVMKNDYVGFNDKGEKIVAKSHGGPIEIYGVTVATVDDKVRLQTVDTWFDPLEMFRQIAPHGIVNKTPMNRNVDMETAMDEESSPTPKAEQLNGVPQPNSVSQHPTNEQKQDVPDPVKPAQEESTSTSSADEAQTAPTTTELPAAQFSNDGVKIAEQHNHESVATTAPEEVIPKDISNGTSQAADEFVPHQGADTEKPATETNSAEASPAQTLVEAAASNGASADIEHPESNFHDAHEEQSQADTGATQEPTTEAHQQSQVENDDSVKRSIYSSSVTGNEEDRIALGKSGNFTDESRNIRDAVDDHIESSSDIVHPHAKDMEHAVQPQAGEAVASSAQSEETRMTHEEMSSISAAECPFLMNRE
ncbi:hypothetical protein LTR97_001566 [Elasticomyces elasticus]|uniref:Pathogen-related protein n=1 Tax=Elasticomyces elasticus TaxID=574655 RepID=A0AAN7WI51_9PEZI|nr:hypothetical protein LTR97_001566 [Elasticomyces elasticus]